LDYSIINSNFATSYKLINNDNLITNILNKEKRMKKIFTLIAMAMMAIGVNAQDWNASNAGSLPKGTKILDNSYVTIVTAVQDTEASLLKDEQNNNDPKAYAGYTFTKYVNIRVEDAPSADNNFEGTAYSGASPNGISLIVTAKQNTDVTLYYKHGDGKAVSCYDQTGKDNVAIAETAVSGLSNYYTGVYKFIAGHTYTIYAKGGTTGLNGISTAAGTYVEPQNKVYSYSAKANLVTYGDGATMQITSNTSKNYGNGASITVNGAAYTGIKNSNGAQNTFTAATGKKIYRMTFYAIPNNDGDAPKFQEFNGATLDIPVTTVKDGTQATQTIMCVNGAETVTFTYGGKQVVFVVDVDYSEASYDKDNDPTAGTDGIQAIKSAVIDLNGAIYNLAGQKVSNDFKGLVIKNGKKFVVK